jgi:hypothetical protein
MAKQPWTPGPGPWPKGVPRLPRTKLDSLPRIKQIPGQLRLFDPTTLGGRRR